MSLDVYLTDPTATYKSEPLYTANITHNLNKMAMEAGIYEALWRPENIGATKAKDIIPILEKGLKDLRERQSYYEEFNPSNGWGTYGGLVQFVDDYLQATKDYPEAIIEISR